MTHRHKALIVDDQQGIMEILGAILSSLDHDYDYARTQREARELLKANHYCYVLLDLEFPADEGITARIQTGFNCLAEIRQRFHRDDLPVIVMTAHENGTEYPIRALQLGANDFAQKDFDQDLEPLDVKIARLLTRGCVSQKVSEASPPPLSNSFHFHGECRSRRYRMSIRGKTVYVRLGTFTILWKLWIAALDGSGGWVPGRSLNPGNYHNAISRLRRDLAEVSGFEDGFLEGDGHGMYRLSIPAEGVSCDQAAMRIHHESLFTMLHSLEQPVV